MFHSVPVLSELTDPDAIPVDNFIITVSSDDIYLCGNGFGGLHGCVDEAISREAKSVEIRAHNESTTDAVAELLDAIRAAGIEDVSLATISDSDT